MSEEKESSVLFSLKELMNLEEDRIRNEESDRQSAAAAAERARQEAERRAREEEEARIRAEEERRRQDESRAREENARLEAIRLAEVEKARVEAEQRARLEAMAAQQAHERSLEQLKADKSKSGMKKVLIALAVGVPLLLGGGIYYAVKTKNENEIAQAAKDKQLADARKEADDLKKKIKDSEAKQAELNNALANAKDQATRDALQKQLDDEKAKTAALKGGPGPKSTGAGGPATDSAPKKKCAPGDPLCSEF